MNTPPAELANKKPTFHSYGSMLAVKSSRISAEWYRDKLGFGIDFIYDATAPGHPNYAVVRRECVELHFESYNESTRQNPPREKCGIYVLVDDVDAMHQEVTSQGLDCAWPPTNQDYGIRDFKLFDPDGYQVIFGTRL